MKKETVVREFKAMHEEHFWSRWLREDEKSKAERKVKAEGEGEVEGEKRRRGEEKEENETETVKRRCVGFVSVEAFEICSHGRDLESCGDLSWEDFLDTTEDLSDRESGAWVVVPVVLAVTDVLVSPSSVVTEFCDVSSCCSDWDFVEPQSFSFSKKRSLCCTSTQEELRFEEPQVKAPLSWRRRMTLAAPMQKSYTSFVRDHGRYEEEGRGWNARE